jgi:hypothetical protein
MLRVRHHRTFQTVFEAALAARPEFIHHLREECSEAASCSSMIRKVCDGFPERSCSKIKSGELRKAPERETRAQTVS